MVKKLFYLGSISVKDSWFLDFSLSLKTVGPWFGGLPPPLLGPFPPRESGGPGGPPPSGGRWGGGSLLGSEGFEPDPPSPPPPPPPPPLPCPELGPPVGLPRIVV